MALVHGSASGRNSVFDGIVHFDVAVTGYHRQHAIRVLRRRATGPSPTRQYPVRYDADDREALAVLWEASDRLCSKRLKPLIPILLPALERHGRLDLGIELRDELLTISAATMDRRPASHPAGDCGATRGNARTSPARRLEMGGFVGQASA